MEKINDENPSFHNIWTYNETGNRYRIKDIGQMKIADGDWVDSVTYMCLKTARSFTRDLTTFRQKFTKAEE